GGSWVVEWHQVPPGDGMSLASVSSAAPPSPVAVVPSVLLSSAAAVAGVAGQGARSHRVSKPLTLPFPFGLPPACFGEGTSSTSTHPATSRRCFSASRAIDI